MDYAERTKLTDLLLFSVIFCSPCPLATPAFGDLSKHTTRHQPRSPNPLASSYGNETLLPLPAPEEENGGERCRQHRGKDARQRPAPELPRPPADIPQQNHHEAQIKLSRLLRLAPASGAAMLSCRRLPPPSVAPRSP